MYCVTSQLFTFEGSQISYHKFGTGPSVLLAFHGFGQTNQVYKPLDDWQNNQFTIFAIDLFFHGDSLYQNEQLLTKLVWHRFLTAFLTSHQIDRFSLMGFSLGGRFALITVEAFADQLDQLFLLAPDGITQNFWYQVATRSSAGRWLFRYTMRHLHLLNSLGRILTQLGLLNRSVMRFVELSLATAQQRELVYLSWTQFRLLQPDLTLISQLLNKQPIGTYFFTGAFDRLVPGVYILPLSKRLNRFKLTILRTGHNHLIELTAQRTIDQGN